MKLWKKYKWNENETHKLFCAGEVKEFDQAEVVAGHDVQATVRHTGTADFCFVSISGPNPQNLISQDTEGQKCTLGFIKILMFEFFTGTK